MEKQEFYKIVAKYNAGKASAAEIKFLEAYYKAFDTQSDFVEKPDDVEAGQFWDLMKSEIDQRIEEHASGQRQVKTSRVYKIWPQIAAASILLILSVSGYFLLHKGASVSRPNSLVYFSPIGKKLSIKLSDGTEVMLNGGSSLQVSNGFNKVERLVTLKGEGYFTVVHNDNVPFIVHTAHVSVKDLGTEFNIKAYPEDKTTEASLIKGSVEIIFNDKTKAPVFLVPNKKLVFQNKNTLNSATKINTVIQPYAVKNIVANTITNTIVETDWAENKLTFSDDESFDEVIIKMERWYGVKMKIINPEVKNNRFTATFDGQDIIQVLEALKLSGNFNYRKEGNVISIY